MAAAPTSAMATAPTCATAELKLNPRPRGLALVCPEAEEVDEVASATEECDGTETDVTVARESAIAPEEENKHETIGFVSDRHTDGNRDKTETDRQTD